MDAVKMLREYADQLESAEKTLQNLESRTQELKGRVVRAADDQRDATQANVEALSGNIEALEEEAADLKSELFDAWAYGKTSEQQRLKKRMSQVQAEIEQHQKELDGLLVSLENLRDGYDLDAAVAIAAERDRVKLPSAYDTADELRKVLVLDVSALQARKPKIPGEGTPAFEAARRAADAEYASSKRFEDRKLESLSRKVEANRALTEAMRDNKGDNRDIDPVTGYDKAGARYRAYERKTATV